MAPRPFGAGCSITPNVIFGKTMATESNAGQISAQELDLPAALRAYQWQGVSFLARADSALLADEMGLGKTVQAAVALRLALQLPDCDRALIVAPAPLTLNWERELGRWAPNLTVRRLCGSKSDREAGYQLPIPVLVGSYEQVRLDVCTLDPDSHFDIVILDEGQRIKNTDSETAFACRLLPRSRAWVLTGTPVENSVDDLLSIFRFLKPGLLHSGMPRFELHDRIRPFFLRRRKKEVLPDLPPIIVQDLPLELEVAQRRAYDAAWESRKTLIRSQGESVSDGSIFALITRLKQLCNYDPDSDESVKLDSLRLIIDALSEPTDKVLIFSQYVETLKWLSERLGDIPYDLYHGQLSESVREDALARFEREPGPRALLVSLRAGGVGLNLPSASVVVLFDRWWNPAVENQAIQRAHRFGRDRLLQVVRFLVVDSIEERIDTLLGEKQVLFDQYVEKAENAPVRPFSRNELRTLLDLPAA
jgi:SNF2 family DNA or RNA helicase